MAVGGYKLGEWKATCDRCGRTYYSSQLRLEWTGLRTCFGPNTTGCWEPRHPQDFVRGVRDDQSPPWVRPKPEPVFISDIGEVDPSDL